MSDELKEALKEFLIESHENLDKLDRELVAIESSPCDRDRLAAIFRTVHSIKGTCGFFTLPKLEALAHAGESLLVRLRDGEVGWSPTVSASLLALVDLMRLLLTRIELDGAEGELDSTEVIAALEAIEPPQRVASDRQPPLAGDDPTGPPSGTAVVRAHSQVPAGPPRGEPANPPGFASGNVRVDVAVLDHLMNLVGELVLARNQILQHAARNPGALPRSTAQRLNLITTGLQDGLMKTRMQPIGNIWNSVPRLVRDLALACGKKVRVDMEGSQTELDKTILEAIKDPLIHLVRNAVDHGIEPPQIRAERAKPETGRISLRAFHENGQVSVEVVDDGGGIDSNRVIRRAIDRGLIRREMAARLDEREAYQLLYLAGFSTVERVTNISGRGVGLDVVKNHVERIGGTIDLESRPGLGTTFKIRLPLTLAIIPALIVRDGRGDRYAIPQVNLVELLRLHGDTRRRSVQTIQGASFLRHRGCLVPLIGLDRVLRFESMSAPVASDAIDIVVLRTDAATFGLVVSAIQDTEEIVIKPLGKQLGRIPVFAGATIMGDGRVALILDAAGIALLGGVGSDARRRSDGSFGLGAAAGPVPEREPHRLLLLADSGGRRTAIPMESVTRLEEFPTEAVERNGRHEMVQYRGEILRLLRLDPAPGLDPATSCRPEVIRVVVVDHDGRRVGLVVDQILDTVERPPHVHRERLRRGLIGSTVIDRRVTELIDLDALLPDCDPSSPAEALA